MGVSKIDTPYSYKKKETMIDFNYQLPKYIVEAGEILGKKFAVDFGIEHYKALYKEKIMTEISVDLYLVGGDATNRPHNPDIHIYGEEEVYEGYLTVVEVKKALDKLLERSSFRQVIQELLNEHSNKSH
jgi:hypothetical protein